jgi:hypothetical protein
MPRATQVNAGMPEPVASITVTQACLPFAVCCPQIVCISPNAETWINGATYAFPNAANFAADERYGAQWQAQPVTEIPDPFWSPPAPPSGIGNCAWTEDDGSCEPDNCVNGAGPVYYAHRPMVEALSAVPSGSPALPSGIYLNILTIPQLNTTPTPGGVVAPPPTGPGYDGSEYAQPLAVHTPWGLWLRELGCVCAHGRWTASYQADAVEC